MSCPWCERTSLLGQDPFPAVATAAAPRPAPKPATQPAPQAPLPATAFQPGSKPVSYNRALLGTVARSRAYYVQRIAIGVVAAVIGLAAVGLTRRGMKANNIDKNLPQTTQSPDQPTTASPGQQKTVKENGSIQVNAIVLCQGVDAARNPVGAAATFRESDFRNHSLTIHAGYRNTSTEDATFQVNWHIGGQTFAAGPYQLTRGAGAIILEFEDRVPAGSHSVDVLINGALSRRAEFVVTADATPAVFETRERTVPESSTPQAAATKAPVDQAPESQAAAPLSKSHTYAAKHKHKLGSCTGSLTMNPESATFTSSEHSMTFLRKAVTVDQDGIDGTGKTWRFSIAGIDVASVLQVWKDRGTVY